MKNNEKRGEKKLVGMVGLKPAIISDTHLVNPKNMRENLYSIGALGL